MNQNVEGMSKITLTESDLARIIRDCITENAGVLDGVKGAYNGVVGSYNNNLAQTSTFGRFKNAFNGAIQGFRQGAQGQQQQTQSNPQQINWQDIVSTLHQAGFRTGKGQHGGLELIYVCNREKADRARQIAQQVSGFPWVVCERYNGLTRFEEYELIPQHTINTKNLNMDGVF